MKAALETLARSRRWRLTGARMPRALVADAPAGRLAPAGEALVRGDLIVCESRIEAVTPPGALADAPALDLAGAMVWPGLVDCHTHLDKGHVWPRAANSDGSFAAALEATARDRSRHWTVTDVTRRMRFALEAAHAHGTVAIRTHLDTERDRMADIWDAFRAVQAEWRDRIDLQPACLLDPADLADPGFRAAVLAELAATPGAALGAFVQAWPDQMAALRPALRRMVQLAADRGLALDFHVDETTDPASHGLRAIAEAVLETGVEVPVLCGHCVAPALQAEAETDRTLDLAARAGLAVVSLPLCNSYLQDRAAPGARRTPRLRGVAPLHEMAARGIAVALASDNTRDPFHAYGDLDLVEVYRMGTRILQLDHPVADWPATVAAGAARTIGRDGMGLIAPGRPADLIVFAARGWSELLSRPQADRVVIRNGRVLDATPPDFRTLDDLDGFGGADCF